VQGKDVADSVRGVENLVVAVDELSRRLGLAGRSGEMGSATGHGRHERR